MIAGNFTTGKKTDQGHIAQRAPDDLQLCAGPAKVRSPAARTTDINSTRNAPGRMRRGFCFTGGPYSDHGHTTHYFYVKRYRSIKAKTTGDRHSYNKLL